VAILKRQNERRIQNCLQLLLFFTPHKFYLLVGGVINKLVDKSRVLEKDEHGAPLSHNLFQLNYSLHVSNKHVLHQEVISVLAAYSISVASMGCLAANTIRFQ
jgi:hypothetical protein